MEVSDQLYAPAVLSAG